jgi:hypothetical protein
MEHAHAIARAAAAAFDAAGGGGPAAGTNGGPPSGVRDGGWVDFARLLGSPLTGAELGIITGGLEQDLKLGAYGVRKLVTFAGDEMLSVGWRYTDGGRTWVARAVHGVTKEAYDQAIEVAAGLEKVGKGAKIAGGLLGVVTGAADQYGEDTGRKDLSTTDKVGRVVAAGAYKGAFSFGGGAIGAGAGAAYGAALGTAVPVPIVGTVAGAAIGAVVGGVIGSGVGESIADMTKAPVLNIGSKAANLAVDGAKATADIVKGAGKALDSITSF